VIFYRLLVFVRILAALLFLAWLAPGARKPVAVVHAQQSSQPATAPQAQSSGAPVLKAESRVVRVDVVVMDKKGNYVEDLKATDFKVYDDNKEQKVENFSFGSDPAAPVKENRHYLVLFFDNSTMDVADQPRARAAAKKFIEANAGSDRVMAVAEFTGALHIVQNFTADADRLAQVVTGVKTSAISPNAPLPSAPTGIALPAGVGLGNSEADFGAYSVLLAIRSLAKNLASIPGRKSLILFTSGFQLTPENTAELTATIDACNKANVAIYPLDVRGLDVPMTAIPKGASLRLWPVGVAPAAMFVAPVRSADWNHQPVQFRLASYSPSGTAIEAPQHGGGGGGGGHGGGGGGMGGGGGSSGGGHSGGGSGGTGGTGGKGGTGGTGGTTRGGPAGGTAQPSLMSPYAQPRTIVPTFPASAATNQQVLYSLAEGTGGFTIFNTNDLLAGLQKISSEQNEYYLLGFVPSDSPEGSCHTLKVKVDRGGTNVRARSGYCNVKPTDVLAGKPIEKDLELRAASASAGDSTGALQAPFFYTSPNEARVSLVMEVPPSAIDFSKVKGKYHAEVNFLGIAYKPDGSVAARFSDESTLDLEKDDWKKFTESPMRYENQFEIAPGQYKLSMVLSGGNQKFAKYEAPLTIEPYDGKSFTVSSISLSKEFWRVADLGGSLDADLLADRTPMIVHGIQFVPAGNYQFKKSDKVGLYVQAYDPRITDSNPPKLAAAFSIADAKSGAVVLSSGMMDMSGFVEKGKAVIPMALVLPVNQIPAGSYVVTLQVGEAGGPPMLARTAAFQTE
jgi:VWFA-related protein